MLATVRVLIIDDHAVFCDALSAVLRLEPDIEVVGKGGSVREAVEAVQRLRPDVVLLDVHLPDGSGIDALGPMKAAHPSVQVVILTTDEDEALLRTALGAGITGYLSKHEGAAEVLQAVRAAAQGEVLVAPYMLARLLHGLERPAEPPPSAPLTPRELSVLNELALGRDNVGVARALNMSPNTVRTHVQHILSKLQVHSKLEAVSRAIRQGWIRIPQEPAA